MKSRMTVETLALPKTASTGMEVSIDRSRHEQTMKTSSSKYVATTPKHISEAIRGFCSQLSAEEPVFLDIHRSTSGRPGMCYDNAARAAADRLGGQIVYGWLVWELDGIYLTAEHHAVLEADGKLIDVTPQFAGERTVLFVPDRATEFHPPRPANKYVPLVKNTLIERFVEIAQRNSELELAGKVLGYEHSENDRQMTRLLDLYLSRPQNDRRQKAQRMKKKDERSRKKQARRNR